MPSRRLCEVLWFAAAGVDFDYIDETRDVRDTCEFVVSKVTTAAASDMHIDRLVPVLEALNIVAGYYLTTAATSARMAYDQGRVPIDAGQTSASI